MPYAVMVPGINTVYETWAEVERIAVLYPYPRFRKFKTTEECWEYVRRHTAKKVYRDVNKYGETFKDMYVRMEYFIRPGRVCYNFFTKKIGYIAIENNDPNISVTNRSGSIKVVLNEIYLNDDLISNHLIAIWHGLRIIGTMIDVDIQVPDHSIFYALMTYKGKNKTITRVREYIDRRPAKVSVSLRDFNEEEEV